MQHAQAFIVLSVSGRPVAKGRPRFSELGHAYTPERTRNAEEIMQGEMRQECQTPLEGLLELNILFRFRRPDSWPKARRDAVRAGDEPWYPGKPDLDNLVKLVKDAGKGVLWKDDSQVVKLEAIKVYSAENKTLISVFPARIY